MIRYYLEMTDPVSHYFDIRIEIEVSLNDKDYFDLKLPVWRSGRYLILEFASGLQGFIAVDENNKELKWNKLNKYTWRIFSKSASAITVSYRMYANEFEMRTKGLDQDHAFVNPTSLFMFSDELRYEPLTLKVDPFGDWHVTTGLKQLDSNLFSAPSYDYFVDCPLEIGNQRDYDFEVQGRKHVISIFGTANFEINKLIADFTSIINRNYEFWGRFPYEEYFFIVHCSPLSSGGTEHINSTVVGIKPKAFDTDEGYKAFLRLISHEFFHTWNVKQLKPAGLTPYNYVGENYTSELWIAEGGTSYYDGLLLTQLGLMTEQDFYEELTRAAGDERRRPGYRVQSVADSSFDAWIKFWRRTANAYETESDYYVMGSYVCMVLDLIIRNDSVNKYSLDDVLKAMYDRFPLDKKGYTNEDLMKTCEEFSGTDLRDFFDDHVFGTEPIAWEKYFSYAGLSLFKLEDSDKSASAGMFPEKDGHRTVITRVLEGSPADKAGLIKGDEIIALDRERGSFETIEKRIKSMKPGDSVTFTVFRSNSIMQFTISIDELITDRYGISKIDDPTNLQRSIYEKWLNVKW